MELLITLGHNASAIAVRKGQIIAGYEEERHDRLKSASIFPIKSIQKCIDLAQPTKEEDNYIFVSHWFDDFNFITNNHQKIHEKFWNQEYINSLMDNYGFILASLNNEFTHHDAHAFAVSGFYEHHGGDSDEALILVADGFGNKQEVLSLYNLTYDKYGMRKMELFHRSYGYGNSLGLFYQYATSYCGMKENQDEYKFLGYESHIRRVLNENDYNQLHMLANFFAEEMIEGLEHSTNIPKSIDEKYINKNDLEQVKKKHWNMLDGVLNKLTFENDENNFNKRVIVGNFIQTVLELVTTHFVVKYSPGTVLVNGGIFYNVKLNNKLARVSEKFCVIPLAGDQGAAIGMYIDQIGPFDFSNLFWGKRNIPQELESIDRSQLPENVEIYDTREELVDRVVYLLERNQIPQVVLSDMEFGPRALCHSTTYAIPYKENVELINTYNKRNTVMPMAPIILRNNLDYFFSPTQYNKTIGSDGFMILTYDYQIPYSDLYSGVMHKYPNEDLYSGRPQVVNDDNSTVSIILKNIQETIKALINTSYNIHGKPIVFTIEHALDDFKYQLARAEELNLKKPYLIIGTYSE